MILGLPLAVLVDNLISFYTWLIIAWAIMSWFPLRGLALEIHRLIATVVEPYIRLFRHIVPTMRMGGGGLDLSPLIAILVLQVIRQFLFNILIALRL